ncbi:MAG: OsmC family protein [Bacteroidetes bacterium]|nr:OsmC family protein [Bacteroidota bacterium]
MHRSHRYTTKLTWTGNLGSGTADYTGYSRNHTIVTEGKPVIAASSDPLFRGDRSCYNPEELLVASLSSCHMLWFLHLCSESGLIVIAYEDAAEGTLQEDADGSGRFIEVILHPVVTVYEAANMLFAKQLHEEAHKKCFISNSCNFPVKCEAVCRV